MRTPPEILEKFENAKEGMVYGSCALIYTVKMGKPRFEISRNESIIPSTDELSVGKHFVPMEENKKTGC